MKAIIIDDELGGAKLLSMELAHYCPHIELVAICLTGEEGLECIKTLKPQLVFLDIQMPKMNGFQLLGALQEISFALIFTTAYDQFAVRAFRYSAVDFLLKPIVVDELIDAVAKVDKYVATDKQQIAHLQQQIENGHLAEMAILSELGLKFIQLNEILYCESSNTLANIQMISGQCFSLSKTLGDLQELLQPFHFQRVHRQYIVNLNQIKKFVKADNSIVLSNGQLIPVSRGQKDKLMEKFDWL